MELVLKILAVGLEPEMKELILALDKSLEFHDISTAAEFEEILEHTPETKFIFVVCGSNIKELPPAELAQSLRALFSENSIYFATSLRQNFDRKEFIKNGFTDAFLLPLDTAQLKSVLVDDIKKNDPKGAKIYKSVKLIDIQAGSNLNFDLAIYLPMNKKYIKFAATGDPIDQTQVDKLQKHKVSSVYVEKDQMPKFYEYSAGKLKDLAGPNAKMSETERRDRLQTAVRDLITGLFNDNAADATIAGGRGIVSTSQEIVATYIMNDAKTSKGNEWYSDVVKAIGEGNDSYSHTSRVSTFASLFSIGLEAGKPQDLAIAGMFHDLGLADVPQSILNKAETEWSTDEKKLYYLHPEGSIKIMKERKLIVPESVMRAILQHHERFDGTGLPKGTPGPRISIEAQLLALADKFDYLTTVQEGKATLTPVQAIKTMQAEAQFNPELLKKMLTLFPKEA
jgi:HD-GYP domain-containing protein (c-di-GMP phosphodiesterase class II)